MNFEVNVTLEERCKEKEMRQIKYQLHDKKGHDFKDIKSHFGIGTNASAEAGASVDGDNTAPVQNC